MRALLHRRVQLLVELGLLAARDDEAVPDAAGEPGGERPGGGDVDRHRLVGPVVDRRLLGAVVLAVEGDALLGPEAAHQLDRLGEAQPALLRARPLRAGRGRLVQRLAGADAEEDAAGVEAGERPERLRDHRRVVAHRRRQHARAEQRALGALAERAEPRERRPAPWPPVWRQGWKWSETATISSPCRSASTEIVEQLARPELLGGGLVPELQQARGLHPAPDPPACRRRRRARAGRGRRGRRRARRGRLRCRARRSASGRGPGGRIETAFVPPSSARAIAIPRSGVAVEQLLDLVGAERAAGRPRHDRDERRGHDLLDRRRERVVPGEAAVVPDVVAVERLGGDDGDALDAGLADRRRRHGRAASASGRRAPPGRARSARRLFARSSAFSGTSTWASTP